MDLPLAYLYSRAAPHEELRFDAAPAVPDGAIASVSAVVPKPASFDKALFPLGALMLAASVSSWAQTAPAAGDRTLSTVTVKEKAESPDGKDALRTQRTSIGKGTQDIRDIPHSISVITAKLL